MNRIAAGFAAAVIAAAAATSDASAAAYSRLVVFGDSLSDVGNAGRFTDGPLWVERLAEGLGLAVKASKNGGAGFAVGGARTHGHPGSLRDQADAYLRANGGRADRRALYVVFGGGNDILTAPLAADPGRVVNSGAIAIAGIVADLAAAGATTVLVPSLPDVGDAPYARALGPLVSGAATAMTMEFNESLAAHLDELQQLDGIRLIRPDFYALHADAVARPERAGLIDTARPCSDLLRGTRCRKPAEYLYWDGLHPSSTGHRRMAATALRAVQDAPR